jgi:hypothetical protein
MKSNTPKKIDWLMFWIISFISVFLFSQNFDLTITAQHSLSLIDAVTKGQFFHFYGYVYHIALAGGYGTKSVKDAAFYSIVLYGTFSVWNLPMWIFSKVTGISISAFAFMMWDKILIFIVFLICAYIFYKLGIELKMSANRSKWMAFVFLTSPVIMFGALIFAQYDLFSVVFTLLALLMYLRKKPYQFAMLMALAICYKDFAVLLFVPLILLTEKRMLHIIKYLLIGMSLFLLQNIVFHFDPYYSITQKALSQMYGFEDRIFANGLSTGFGTAFFLGIGMIFLCVFAYIKHIKDDVELAQYATYIPLVAYGIFFSFLLWHPPWVVVMIPFLIICAFMNRDFKLSMFLEIAMSFGYLIVSFMIWPNNVDQNMVNGGFLPKIFGFTYDNHITLGRLAAKTGLSANVFFTVFMSAVLVNLILKYPGFHKAKDDTESTVFLPERSVLWVRALTVFVFIAPTLALYFYYLIKVG